MLTPRKDWFQSKLGTSFPLADVMRSEGRLVVKQSNGPALRNLRNTGLKLLGGIPCLVFVYMHSTGTFGLVGPNEMLPPSSFLFLSIPFLVMTFQSINRFFGQETFIFDRNEDVFIRNGFKVGPLREIRAVKAQVTGGLEGQFPIFRLILELPWGQIVTIVRTHDIPAKGEFQLSRKILTSPERRFPMFAPWLNYEEQDLVPFLPPEIMDLRQTILDFVAEPALDD